MEKVSLLKIFGVFSKIGTFTIGGGYAMIPVIENEMTRRGWISQDDFPDIIALAQAAPGLLAVNMSIFAGYKLRGVKGSIIATLGSITPSFVIILLIAMVFSSFQDNAIVQKLMMGMRPVAIALIAAPMFRMAKKSIKSWWSWALCIIALVGVAFLKISPMYILLVVIIGSLSLGYYKERRAKK